MARVAQQEEEEETVVYVGSLFYLTNINCRLLLARLSYDSRPSIRLPRLTAGNIKVRPAYEIK